jgi:hypothetical protein
MHRLRARTLAVRILVALFLAAQFAGVVASPLTQAHTASAEAIAQAGHHHAGADHAGKHQADSHRHDGCAYPDACTDDADYCCALHAFFVGILPPAAAVDNVVLTGETLHPAVTSVALGLHPSRLDRPPRSLS